MIAVAIIFVVFVIPIWLTLHYVTKWRSNRGLNNDEMQTIGEIWQMAQRLEARIDVLETNLQDDKT